MARNVEIKARLLDIEAAQTAAAVLANEGPTEIHQDDTFFRCDTGRLKLRDFLNGTGQLIFYQRANQTGPKESFYLISGTTDPHEMRTLLSTAYGVTGRVIKHRTLFIAGRTRIHLDRVEGLGVFLELEVVLSENEPVEAGEQDAHSLMTQLGVEPSQLIEGAYVDLITEKAADS